MAQGYSKAKTFVGVNLTDPPTDIADNQLAWARNCWPTKKGYIGPRSLQSAVGTAAGGADFQIVDRDNIITLFNFIDANGVHRTVLYATVNNGVFGSRAGKFFLGDNNFNFTQAIERHDSTETKYLEFGAQRPVGLVHNNELFIFMGHTCPGLILGAGDMKAGAGNTPKFRQLGTTWAAFTGATASQFQFSFGDVYKDVFVLGGLGPPYESLLFFTQGVDSTGNIQVPYYSLLNEATRVRPVGWGDGDRLIRAMTTPILGGSAAVEPYIIAFKQRSVWMLQGDTPVTTDAGTLVVSPVQRREGLIAAGAVCVTPYGIVWCSGRNVWLMPPGQKPVAIGDDIKGFLETLPQQPAHAWHLTYHDDVLYLNFPSHHAWTGVPVGGGSAQLTATQQMWCDLRNPDEPRWWGPQDVHAGHMLSLDLPDGAHQLLGVTATVPGGVLTHQPFNLVPSTSDGLDLGYADLADFTFAGDGPVPRTSFQHVKFKEFDFGDDSLEKLIDALEVNASWDLAISANSDPMVAGFLGNGGKKNSVADIDGPPTPTVTVVANPYVGSRSAGEAANNGTLPFSSLTWNNYPRARQARLIAGGGAGAWDGGEVTITGTDINGVLLEEVFSPAALGALSAGQYVESVGYFRTITDVSKAFVGANTRVLTLEEGALAQQTTEATEADPTATGFMLDTNALDSLGLENINLSETFVPLVFFPPNSSRFMCRTFQPNVYGVQASKRRFTIRSITPRVRPIGRRPGGNYGGLS